MTSQILQMVTMVLLFFYKTLPKKNGNTVVTICKICEVMKSYIIILFVDCNTHLHT